MASGLGRNRP